MTTRELPTMQSSAYAASTYDPSAFANQMTLGDASAQLGHLIQQQPLRTLAARVPIPVIEKEPVMTRRLVQVLIADTNESVPLDAALLYSGAPLFTDLADDELFFELDIKGMLAIHNVKRVTFPDKKAVIGKDGPTMLEPARVRNLKMNVVTIASF